MKPNPFRPVLVQPAPATKAKPVMSVIKAISDKVELGQPLTADEQATRDDFLRSMTVNQFTLGKQLDTVYGVIRAMDARIGQLETELAAEREDATDALVRSVSAFIGQPTDDDEPDLNVMFQRHQLNQAARAV